MLACKLVTQCILQDICICVSYSQGKDGNSCFGSEPSYCQFGTKTDYNTAIMPYLNETTVPLSVPAGCKPTLFYLFQRHTIRYPSAKDIHRAQERLPEIQEKLRSTCRKSKMCKTDIDAILSWKDPFDLEKENTVTDTGKQAVRDQVARLKQRFPSVFANRRGLKNVIVDFSSKGSRTKHTAESFLREWFGDKKYETSIAKRLKVVNPLNMFHEECEAIMKEHGVNSTSANEEILLNSKIFKKFKDTIERRLSFDVRKQDIKAMLTQCRFEVAAYGKSPWCALFGENEFRFTELLDDVEDYDTDAYGSPRNTMVACRVAIDLLNHTRNITQAELKLPRVVLHFSHAGAFKKLSTLLNLANSSTPAQNCTNRAWFSSRQSPFNANLNVVYFTCPKGQENRVAFLLNEKLEQLPCCNEPLCTVDEVEGILGPKADACDLNAICSK
ncbi:multiple inositol polyphosphate phosphatase 1-like [Tropilaelaps mercedesae]|uniref:Multiple inositol polyphosphate phosphatase 1 n=1 Tax=Tropilaelaps mercedesae TaxID=418985 RepID=A0A1V9XR65_9ACAR|nr:multiple inositol polyphosphate phosphatase 1-like [Tropilaelaps mercedesae]